ncbi:hypothetical protein MBANPS3_012387 [Mucor bainieri]
MPQPRGTKNSSQSNRFNETFERFTDSSFSQQTPVLPSPVDDRLERLENSIDKLGNVLELLMAKMSQGFSSAQSPVVIADEDDGDASKIVNNTGNDADATTSGDVKGKGKAPLTV